MKKKIKKNFKQKSFFFEDYNEFEITFNKKDIYLIKVSSNRIIFLFTIFLSLMFIFSIKIIYLSLYPEKNLSFIKINKNEKAVDVRLYGEKQTKMTKMKK